MNQMNFDSGMMNMNPGMMSGMQGMEDQPEMTEEQKAEMEAKMKEEEKRRRKAQIESLKNQIKSKTLALKVMEKGIAKAGADKDVLENVDLPQAENEWHKKAINAQIEELEAILEEARLRLDNDLSEFENTKARLKSLEEADKQDAESESKPREVPEESKKEEKKEPKKDQDKTYL